VQTFVRVIDAGSFSAAARQLGVGQPAVSKTIAQLEERLGVALVLRSTRGLAPTPAGARFAERARRAIAEADAAEQSARGRGGPLEGMLRVSAPSTFASLHLVPGLGGFMAAHPGLGVELLLDDRVIDLVEAGVDLSLRMGDLPDPALPARRLGSSARLVIGAPAYFERAGTPESPAELARHAVVLYAQGRARAWTHPR
jgi:DNA-binding transcriptional LysR family regulator